MEDSKKIKVKSRVNGRIGYTIPDMGNLTRTYEGQEEKIITFEELRKLSYTPGGAEIIKEYLIIRDSDVLEELNLDIEPEYFYGKKEVVGLLQEGSMDEFLDCLDFAPEGVLELIKEYAVTLPVNDVNKRQAIFDKLGFDVNKAIELQIDELKEEKEKEKTAATRRRAAVPFTADSQKEDTDKPARRRVIILEE